MVPNSEDSNGATSSTEQTTLKSPKTSNKGKMTPNKSSANVEKDTEEYRKLRDRNNEAVKKSRTRTKLRTQNTLDKVEKLRGENTKLEDRIEGLKKELELLKELFVSHAGTKSMKRLTEVDLDVLLAEAAPSSKKSKKATTPYTGRSREEIEKEVLALLGQETIESNDEAEDDDGEPQPSTSHDMDQTTMSEQEQSMMDHTTMSEQEQSMMDSTNMSEQEQSMMEDQTNVNNTIECVDLADDNEAEQILTVLPANENEAEQILTVVPANENEAEQILTVVPSDVDGEITETYTIVDDGTGGPHIWTTEDGESVVVTIEQDEEGTLVASTVQQQDLSDIIQGEILMLE